VRTKILLSVVLCAVTLAVFMQTVNHQFINYDDPGYVTSNPLVKGGLTAAGFTWAFTTTAMSNWHPLTWLSHMTDVQLFGLDPRGHHLTSVVIHTASALLLFLLLARITGVLWQSFAVAALFALHPLHVESVAWVAERKDVLSFLLWLLTLLFYSRFVKKLEYRWYFCALLAFIAGLMTKPMLVTLPLVMLLLDYWPFNRCAGRQAPTGTSTLLGRYSLFLLLVKEKAPFFLLSMLSAVITIYGQHKGGSMASLVKVPVGLRIENALISYIHYIGLMFWPHDLAILYPFPRSFQHWQVIGAGCLLVLISLLVIRCRQRCPYLVTGWFWYLVTLLPVIGLFQVGSQALADRYTYIPLTGLFIACCWLIPELLQGWRHRQALLGILAGVAISALTSVTWHQLGYWKDNLTLYRHTLAVTSGNFLILNNYGAALEEQGRIDDSVAMFRQALGINPDHAEALYNLGRLYLQDMNRPQDALALFARAIAVKPDYVDAYNNLAVAFNHLGQYNDTVRLLDQVSTSFGDRADIHNNLAVAYTLLGTMNAARRELEAVRRLDMPMAQRLEGFMNSPRRDRPYDPGMSP
jgi:protein O-mannosyl-transferase